MTRSFDVFFDLRPINGWVNNGDAGDLRRHRAHYDVIVIFYAYTTMSTFPNRHDDKNTLMCNHVSLFYYYITGAIVSCRYNFTPKVYYRTIVMAPQTFDNWTVCSAAWSG